MARIAVVVPLTEMVLAVFPRAPSLPKAKVPAVTEMLPVNVFPELPRTKDPVPVLARVNVPPTTPESVKPWTRLEACVPPTLNVELPPRVVAPVNSSP